MKNSVLSKLFIGMIMISSQLFAQIPNNGFENWDQSEPIDWVTSNAWFLKTVSATENSHSGLKGMKLTTLAIGGMLMPAIASSGTEGDGFPVSERHQQLSLFYKFNSTNSTAYFFVSVGMIKNGEAIGGGVTTITSSANSFTALNIPITYIDNQIPDSAVIMFQVADPLSDTSASGTYAIVDDLSFNLLTDVTDDRLTICDFNLEQNFPNPFNPSTSIRYSIGVRQHVKLNVYDAVGNEIAALVNEEKSPGTYNIIFDASALSSGVYFYTLSAGSKIYSKKMIFIK